MRRRIWLLSLVPDIRFGRWWSSAVLFIAVAGLLAASGGLQHVGYSWSVALFFCVIIAYIIPVFHFITQRTEEALDELAPCLTLSPGELNEVRRSISEKSLIWVLVNLSFGTGLWLLQSRLLAGSGAVMLRQITAGVTEFVSVIIPLLVWLSMTCAIVALVDNARLFRRLSKNTNIDLLDMHALTPFGRMAVSSTLVVIGAQASFSIMWLEGRTDPWTTIPPLIATTIALFILFIAPVWPVHQALRAAKRREIDRLQKQINAHQPDGQPLYVELAPLLAYRREIINTRDWPFDMSIVARFGLYLVIVPLTWIGAALIEIVVDAFVT